MSRYRMLARHGVLAAAVAAVVIGGCTMSPKYERPAAPIPTTLPTGGAYGGAKWPTTAASAPASEMPWQDFITDLRLRQIVAMSLENNRNLRLAALNAQRARELYGIQRDEMLPTLNANAGMTKVHTPADVVGKSEGTTSKRYDVNLGIASWEIDFFGRIRSLSEAALQEYLATEQARNSAQILLVSSVANAYLVLAADRENLALAQTTLDAQKSSYDLVKRRYDRGVVPDLDVLRAQAQVDSARGDVARFTQVVALDENALNLVAGSQVSTELLPQSLGTVSGPAGISPGASSELLLNRPDIVAAENRLKAANANIGAARAAFFPRISLTAALGTASAELSGLFKGGSGAWTFAPQATMPIFDTRVWAASRVVKTEREIAVTEYEKAIQNGFREVADALAVRGTVDDQVAAQESLVRAVGDTYRLSIIRYEKGIDSYLSVLDAQRSLYAAQQGLVSLRLAKVSNQVTLYAALGGGWQPAPKKTDASTTQPAR